MNNQTDSRNDKTKLESLANFFRVVIHICPFIALYHKQGALSTGIAEISQNTPVF